MTESVLIRNGLAVLPDGAKKADIALNGCAIEAVGEPASFDPGVFDQVIEADGRAVLPGAIDVHVHFRTPGGAHKEDWETGSLAALAGGVTTVLDMPNTDPPTTDLAALAQKRALAAPLARVHHGFFMGATKDNLDQVLAAENIAGLKVYMGSSTGGLLVYEEGPLKNIFQHFTGTLAVHAEDEQIIQANSLKFKGATAPNVHHLIRNALSARRATERAIGLARRFDRQLHICHMSTAEELDLVTAADDARITCEVAPHHLVLTEAALDEIGTLAKMNPPLRTEADRAALWRGLAAGRIACVATDHAPHTLKEKMGSYWQAPSGVPGVQHMMPILLDGVSRGVLTLERVAQISAEWPARVYGIENKGRIQAGFDADLCIVDLDRQQTVAVADVVSKCGWTPYEGMTLTGWPETTLLDGRVVYHNGTFPNRVAGREVRFGGG